MRKIRELTCLKYELGRSHREIAASPTRVPFLVRLTIRRP